MIGKPDQTSAFSSQALSGHVIICGLGSLGYRIYSQLDVMGVPVVIIDHSYDQDFADRMRIVENVLLRDDPRHPEALERASIATARALITTFDDDLVNLEVALNASRLNPDLRIVMRFFNMDLAHSIHAAVPNLTALSLSALASPVFVAAAIDPYVRNAMLLDDQPFAVDQFPVSHAGALEDMALGNAFVLAHRHGVGPPQLFPLLSQTVTHGDHVTVIGPEEDLRVLTAQEGDGLPKVRPRKRAPQRLASRIGTLLRNLDQALYITLALQLLVILVSIVIFMLAKNMSVEDALIFFFTVIGATDAGATTVQQDPTWIKIFAVILAIIGAIVLTVVYAFITNYIVSIKLSGLLGHQPVRMENHIVLCGMGTVGYRVLEGLVARGEDVAVLENSPTNRFLPLVRTHPHRRHARTVIGDARLRASLDLVNVADARCIVAATNDDMANIQTALHARQANPRIRVVFRMFDQDAAQRVGDAFNFEVPLSASALAAPTFVSATLVPSVIRSFKVEGYMLSVMRIAVPSAGTSVGRSLGEVLNGLEARVLYRTPTGQQPQYHPGPDVVLAPGDTLVIVTHEKSLRRLTERISGLAASKE